MKSAILAVGMALLTAPLLSQGNLLSNGDFEKGMAGWTGNGTGGSPGIYTEDLTGLGKSQAFAVYPGISVLPVNPYTITQSVPLQAGAEYEFSADIMSQAQYKDSLGPLVEVKIGSASVYQWQRFSTGIQAGTYREKLVARIRPTVTGTQAFKIEFQRPLHVYTTTTPRIFIDNIQLRLAARPSIGVAGDRLLGLPMAVWMEGTPSALGLLFVSARRLPTPIRVPGFVGTWELGLSSTLLVLAGPLHAQLGTWKASIQVPKDTNLLGKSLYWQGIEVGKTWSIGPAHDFNITGA